jgi:hypothetical protein
MKKRLALLAIFAIPCGTFALSAGCGDPQPHTTPADDDSAIERYSDELVARAERGEFASDRAPGGFQASPRVAFFGDSNALNLSFPVFYDLESTGRAHPSPSHTVYGCGLLHASDLLAKGRLRESRRSCPRVPRVWSEAIERGRPDVAIVSLGPWEVRDHLLPGDDHFRHIGDPVFDDRLREKMLEAVDILAADGALVVWLTSPDIDIGDGEGEPDSSYPESDPERMARFNEILREVATLRPRQLRVIDLAAYTRTWPGGVFDPQYRPDRVHWSRAGALKLSREWLSDEILDTYRSWVRTRPQSR